MAGGARPRRAARLSARRASGASRRAAVERLFPSAERLAEAEIVRHARHRGPRALEGARGGRRRRARDRRAPGPADASRGAARASGDRPLDRRSTSPCGRFATRTRSRRATSCCATRSAASAPASCSPGPSRGGPGGPTPPCISGRPPSLRTLGFRGHAARLLPRRLHPRGDRARARARRPGARVRRRRARRDPAARP